MQLRMMHAACALQPKKHFRTGHFKLNTARPVIEHRRAPSAIWYMAQG